MKHKLKLLVCYLLICAFVPMNFAFAAIPIDRAGDGIHIDDIVYYLSHTGSLSNSQIGSLLDQVAPIIPTPTPDITPPVLTLTGDATVSLANGASYTDSGATAMDDIDGNLTEGIAVSISNNVNSETTLNTSVAGIYTYHYNVIDTAGNHAIEVTRTVLVAEVTPTPTPSGGPEGYTFCSNEGQTCSFSGTASVAFGAQGVFNYLTNIITSTDCSNRAFGGDPTPNVAKACYYQINTTETPTPTPTPSEVIDLSNDSNNGTSFGSLTDEVERFQTFTAIGYANLTSVDVKIHKRGGTTQSDVTVQLFATSNDKPIGSVLASTTISSSSVGTSYSSINAPLTYNGLTDGTKYAIVLGQTTEDSASNYEWVCGPSGITGQNYGKFDGDSTWTDESGLGNGWLKVYVN